MKSRFLLIIFLLVVGSQAKESKLMSYLGNFVPSLTEVGILTNCVNVYDKVSNFVRATNKLVGSVQRAKSDWERMRYNIEQIYESVKYLKEIDPYDMDTWQAGLTNLSFSLRNHSSRAIRAFEMLEAHTLGATENYIRRIQSMDDYKKEVANKRTAIREIYTDPLYESELSDASSGIRTYRINTISRLRSLQSADRLILETSTDENERAEAQAHLEELDRQIRDLEEMVSSDIQLEKPDSIIEQTANLIAINLTEIKVCAQRISEMNRASGDLVAAYYRLIGGNVNSLRSEAERGTPDIPIDPLNFDPNDPDKVATPVKPEMPEANQDAEKKDVSNHDILNLYNGAAFLALKQESLKRDLLAMKVNTVAFIVSMEATRRKNTEVTSVAFAHHSRMFQLALEDLQ